MNNLINLYEFIYYFKTITNGLSVQYPLKTKYELIDKMEKKFPFLKNKIQVSVKKGCKCEDPTDNWQVNVYIKKRFFFNLIPINVHIHSVNLKNIQ